MYSSLIQHIYTNNPPPPLSPSPSLLPGPVHSQSAGAGCADERADGHVDVGGAALSAVQTLFVVCQRRLLPQQLQVLLLLLPTCRHGSAGDGGGMAGEGAGR